MALKYYLVENHLPGLHGTNRAVIVSRKPRTLDDVIDEMIRRGSTLTKGEVLAALEEFASALERLLKMGCNITLPLFRISLSIAGRFQGTDDRFDPSRHRVKVNINARPQLKAIAKRISVQKVAGQRTKPVLLHFYDYVTGEIDSVATMGGGARITGKLLKFDEDDKRQGVFIVNASGASTIWIGGKFLRNTGGELIFRLPAHLPPGRYKVEVRTVYKGNKRILAGFLPVELTVRP